MSGVLFIVAAPSGAGKTTLIHRLLKSVPGGTFSVSHTTRPPRPGEVDGRDYHFVDEQTFQRMIRQDEFVEWAEVHHHLYGTAKQEVLTRAESNAYVVFDVDCQGAASLKRIFPDAVSLFVLPPSMRVLKERLVKRGTEAQHSLRIRLADARGEIRRAKEFDFCVVNEDIDVTLEQVVTILRACMFKTSNFMSKINRLLAEEV